MFALLAASTAVCLFFASAVATLQPSRLRTALLIYSLGLTAWAAAAMGGVAAWWDRESVHRLSIAAVSVFSLVYAAVLRELHYPARPGPFAAVQAVLAAATAFVAAAASQVIFAGGNPQPGGWYLAACGTAVFQWLLVIGVQFRWRPANLPASLHTAYGHLLRATGWVIAVNAVAAGAAMVWNRSGMFLDLLPAVGAVHAWRVFGVFSRNEVMRNDVVTTTSFLFAHDPHPLVVTDDNHRILAANRAFSEAVHQEARRHTPLFACMPPLREALTHRSFAFWWTPPTPKAAPRHYSVTAMDLPIGTDSLRVFRLRDTTEFTETIAQLRLAQEDLGREIELRSQELLELSEKESLGTVASSIAHDFGNVLTTVVGCATAARRDLPDDHPIQDDLAEILDAANTTRDTVTQVLAISRMGQQGKTPIEVNNLVSKALPLLRSSAPTDIAVHAVPHPGDLWIIGDATGLTGVLLSLFSNAVAAQTSGAVTVRVSRSFDPEQGVFRGARPVEDAVAVIDVEDTGCGMTPEVLQKACDRFFSTRSATGSTGMGLYTACDIAADHGGGIWLRSAPGKGTAAGLVLPLVYDDPTRRGDTPLARGERLLLLVPGEGDGAAAKVLRRMLSPLGYALDVCGTLRGALAALVADPARFAAVVVAAGTDDPYPVVARCAEECPDTPILVVTAQGRMDLTRRAKEAGAGDVLVQPVSQREIATRLRRLLDTRSAGAAQ